MKVINPDLEGLKSLKLLYQVFMEHMLRWKVPWLLSSKNRVIGTILTCWKWNEITWDLCHWIGQNSTGVKLVDAGKIKLHSVSNKTCTILSSDNAKSWETQWNKRWIQYDFWGGFLVFHFYPLSCDSHSLLQIFWENLILLDKTIFNWKDKTHKIITKGKRP